MAGIWIKETSDDRNLSMTGVMMVKVPTAATTSLHAIYAEDALGLDMRAGDWRVYKPSDFFLRPPKKSLPTLDSIPSTMLGAKLSDAFFHLLKIR